MTNEKDDLEQLLKSAGWLRFLEYARQHWNEQLPARLVAAAELGAHEKASMEVLKMSYAASQINALLSWPKERLKHFDRQTALETNTTWQRGGYVDPQTSR